MVTDVEISRSLLCQIVAHAMAEPMEEVCGLLLGRQGRIEAVVPAANVAADRRNTFELDPAVLVAAHRRARAGGPAVLGHYHSHPGGQASPSRRDAEHAASDGLWLIVAGEHTALFEARQHGPIHDRFHAVVLQVL
jgi:proteasome lid subunit RPN8/RPN11